MSLVDVHGALELRVYRTLNADGGPALDAAMIAFSSHPFGIGFGLLVAALLAWRLRGRAARPVLALVIAITVSDFAGSHLLRPLVPRMRPCYALPPGSFRWLAPAANGPSLPSLHAANLFAVALVATLAWPRLAPFVWAVALAVSVSRVYLGVHWPSDVLAGWCWGAFAGGLAWWASGRMARAAPGR
jgi:undecaprenyl-diphosphatase